MFHLLIYDSGIGGRAVYDQLVARLQQAISTEKISIEYFADHANFPYGTKSADALRQIVLGNLENFAGKYDVIGVACNTASVIADMYLSSHGSGMTICTIIQPTIDKILSLQPNAVVVIGSQFTIDTQIYSTTLHKKSPQLPVAEHAEQMLISLIEQRNFDQSQKIVRQIVDRLEDEHVLVLACTHFSIIKKLFEREIVRQRKNVQIVDSAEELTENICQYIENSV